MKLPFAISAKAKHIQISAGGDTCIATLDGLHINHFLEQLAEKPGIEYHDAEYLLMRMLKDHENPAAALAAICENVMKKLEIEQ